MGAPFVSALGEGSPPRQNLSDFVIDVLGQLRENVLNVAGEVLFEIKHLEGGEDLLRSVVTDRNWNSPSEMLWSRR